MQNHFSGVEQSQSYSMWNRELMTGTHDLHHRKNEINCHPVFHMPTDSICTTGIITGKTSTMKTKQYVAKVQFRPKGQANEILWFANLQDYARLPGWLPPDVVQPNAANFAAAPSDYMDITVHKNRTARKSKDVAHQRFRQRCTSGIA